MTHTETQCAAILAHLNAGHRITGLEAGILFGVGHLPRRILDLKEAGHAIEGEMVEVVGFRGEKKRVKRYSLAKVTA